MSKTNPNPSGTRICRMQMRAKENGAEIVRLREALRYVAGIAILQASIVRDGAGEVIPGERLRRVANAALEALSK